MSNISTTRYSWSIPVAYLCVELHALFECVIEIVVAFDLILAVLGPGLLSFPENHFFPPFFAPPGPSSYVESS